jgi:alkanesulfonate monooxygenase SsuD/methylene tetrahydromethanopterin reductase-like flavin-dependent oxidoreductase (luciferase family)
MRFDMFYELAVPKFTGLSEREVYDHSLEEIALADAAGFDGVWLVEHHFFREYSHCAAPEVVFGAISQRTERMRIGHGVVLLAFNHPVRVAERIAALDILSGGRMDVGVGRGVSPLEYEVFGGTMSESRGRVDEGLEILRRAWADKPFAHDGQFWSFPEIDVVPKPLQKPHPPLWTAAVSPETFPMAAEKGLGVLAGPFKPLFMISEDREAFVKRCSELGRDPAELGFGMTVGVVVLDDHERAREVARTNIRWFYEQLLRLTAPVLEKGGESYRYYREELGTLQALTGGTPSLEALEAAGMVVAGDPEHAIEQLRGLTDHGIDHVLCALQAGGVPHDDVTRSIELMGEHVIPALRGLTTGVQTPGNGRGKAKRPDMRVFLRESANVTPELLFKAMPLSFRRDRADGFRALYRVDLAGDGGGTWWIDIADGRCEVKGEDPGREPDVRIRSDAKTWVELAKGERGQLGAILRRRLRVKGNRRKAAQLARLFG